MQDAMIVELENSCKCVHFKEPRSSFFDSLMVKGLVGATDPLAVFCLPEKWTSTVLTGYCAALHQYRHLSTATFSSILGTTI